MPLNLNDKKAIVSEIAQVAKKAMSAIVANYSGLTVTEMTELRLKARESGVYLKIARNTLAKRAFEGTDLSCLDEALNGAVIVALSLEDPGAAARLFREFIKEHKQLEVKALALSGKLLPADALQAVATLPTYDQAVSMLMSVMIGPATKLVRTLSETNAKLVRTIAAIRDTKQAA